MRMLIIEGSPRSGGNGALLADVICQKYPAAKRIKLWSLEYKGCSACRLCRQRDSACQVEDGLTSVFAELATAGCIVLISPNYCGGVPGEVKQLMDRLFYSNRGRGDNKTIKEGAQLFFVQTVSSGDAGHGSSVNEWLKSMSSRHGLKYYGVTVVNCGYDNCSGMEMKLNEIVSSLAFIV